MSDATAITTVEEIYEFVSVTGSDDDTLIGNLIDRKTEMFERYCGVSSFLVADYTEYHDGQGSPYLFVKNIPINSIDSIYSDADWEWAADTLITATDYRISDLNVIVYKNYFNVGLQNIKITYNAGYSVVPLDLKEALIEEVWRTYSRRKEIDVFIKTLQDGSQHRSPSGLMPATKQVLSKYMRLRAN